MKEKEDGTLSSPRNPLTAAGKESNGRVPVRTFGAKEREIKVDRFIFETRRTLSRIEREGEKVFISN